MIYSIISILRLHSTRLTGLLALLMGGATLATGQSFIMDWNDPGWTNASTGNPSEFLTDPKDSAGWNDVHQLLDAGGTGIDITLTLSHQPNQWNIENRPSLASYFPSPNGANGDILRCWNQNFASGQIPTLTMEFSQVVTISRFGFEGMRNDDGWSTTAYDESGAIVEPNWTAAELAAPPTETTVGDALAAVPINVLRGGVEADSTARYDSSAKAFFMWNKNDVFQRSAGVIDYNGVGARKVKFEMIEVNPVDGTPTGYGSDTSIYLAGGFSIIPGAPPGGGGGPGAPPNLFYTYNFTNEGSVPLDAEFSDDLPGTMVWDAAYTPVTTGGLQVDVGYSNSDKDATINPLTLPPGNSSLTLKTLDLTEGGIIENVASLTLPTGEVLAPEGGGATIELPPIGGVVETFASSYLSTLGLTATEQHIWFTGHNAGVDGKVAVCENVEQDHTNGFVTEAYSVHPPSTGSSAGLDDKAGPGGESIAPIYQDLSALKTEAIELSAAAAGLSSTQTFGVIGDTTTITATAANKINVIAINEVDLGGQADLILSGGANDYFILNIQTKFAIQGDMILNGVPGNHIIVNMLPGSSTLEFYGQGGGYGVFLAPHNTNSILIGGPITGSVAGRAIDIWGKGKIVHDQFE